VASGPDLFVVCKKCGSEVSPYITECPYCGTRLRKRAPKLERGGVPKEPKAARRRRPTLGRLKPGEMPGIRGDRRPYITFSLVLVSIATSLAVRIHPAWLLDLQLLAGTTDEYYRTVTTLFVYNSTGYELVALASIFLGWLLERRHGASGVGGMFLAIAGEDIIIATGGNGAALGLLAAWAMRDVLGRRRGIEDDSDLLGTLAIAAVLILLPLAAEEASALAGLGGGIIGVILGAIFARLPER
jgi:hypothetical protein